MNKEDAKHIILLLGLLFMFVMIGVYLYDYHKNCDGAVVRGMFGLACVAGGR